MEPGEQISPNLKLVRLLGKGGMGAVWVAEHLSLGTQVAVKVMSRAVAAEPELVERFRREALAAAQLKSPHVAQVFDHGVTASGEPYIVMELLEGEDLSKRVDREGPQSPAFVTEVIAQAAKGLTRAHAVGIVHRDIKAENVFLCEHDGDLLVKLLDFGIAKMSSENATSVTSTQGTFGTPLYMSPEQLLSAKRVDARADLWSLAVIAYLLLTTNFPFDGETLGAVSVAVHTGKFTPPSKLRPGLPPEVDAWFARAFHPSISVRFNTAKELAETLRTALGAPALLVVATSPQSSADAARLARLPTMNSGGSAERPPTLSGTSHAPSPSPPRRRTLVIVAGGLAIGLIAGLIAMRSMYASPAAPARDVPSPDVVPTSTARDVPAPDVVPTSTGPLASAAPVVTVEPAGSGASAAPSAKATARAGGAKTSAPGPSAKPSASSSAAPAPKPTSTKDDIGF
ncbi:MAG: protein kinase [Polyangiaceae bacterium]